MHQADNAIRTTPLGWLLRLVWTSRGSVQVLDITDVQERGSIILPIWAIPAAAVRRGFGLPLQAAAPAAVRWCGMQETGAMRVMR